MFVRSEDLREFPIDAFLLSLQIAEMQAKASKGGPLLGGGIKKSAFYADFAVGRGWNWNLTHIARFSGGGKK